MQYFEKYYITTLLLVLPFLVNFISGNYMRAFTISIPLISLLSSILYFYYNRNEVTYLYLISDCIWTFVLLLMLIRIDNFVGDDKNFIYVFGQLVIIFNLMNFIIVYYRITIIIDSLILILLFVRIILSVPNNDYQYRIIYIYCLSIFTVIIFNFSYLILDVKLESSINFNKYYESKLMKVAHDLKNPLSAIQHLTKQNDDINEYRQDIYEEVTEGIEILDDLRMKFKVSNNMTVQEEIGNVDLKHLVDRIPNAHVNLATKCECKINTHFDFQIESKFNNVIIKIQKTIVKRILNNFITNAIKHTIRGVVKISATCYIKDFESYSSELKYSLSEGWFQEGNQINPLSDYAIFTISDTGSGIPPSKMNDIFQEYTDQSDMNWDGCGLGLHICKVLAKDIGATIQYKSNHGVGSVFVLLVPLLNYELVKTDLKLEPNVILSHQNQNHSLSLSLNYDMTVNKQQKYQLLIAEDNKVISKVYSKYLINKNISFKLFHNGKDCYNYVISKMHEELSFIIFTDNQMPEMTGIQLAKQFKQDHIKCQMILVSADHFDTEELFDKVYEKPLPLSKFEEEINMFLNNNKFYYN